MTLAKNIQTIIKEEAKRTLWESPDVRRVVLESRLNLIENAISVDEAGFLDKAKSWLGINQVNPSRDVDDPQKVGRLMSQALDSARKAVVSFKADGLRSSTAINRLQETILDLFGKFFNLLDSIPAQERGKMEREVMKIVGMYYTALMEEKKRIEVYLSHLAHEVGAQGYNLGKSAEAMAGYKAPASPRVQGSRVVDPEADMSPALAGARA